MLVRRRLPFPSPVQRKDRVGACEPSHADILKSTRQFRLTRYFSSGIVAAMESYVAPPVSILSRVRSMKPKSSLFLDDAKPDSIKAMVSRVRKEFKRRKYQTAKQDGGVRVWRLA